MEPRCSSYWHEGRVTSAKKLTVACTHDVGPERASGCRDSQEGKEYPSREGRVTEGRQHSQVGVNPVGFNVGIRAPGIFRLNLMCSFDLLN